jgi:UDP-2,3-diacylglucosamine hydrolase
MKKYTYFISDLHLDENLATINEKFYFFLNKMAPTAEAVYILGDLFRLWLGDDVTSDYIVTIKQSLKKLSEKVPVFVMPGNRDYLLGFTFARDTGCQILGDPTLINLYGDLTLLSHGDIFCTKDLILMLFRRLILNKYVMKVFTFLPRKLRQDIAESVHAQSTRNNQLKSSVKMDVSQNKISKTMKQKNAKQIIHGHTHKAVIDNFLIDQLPVRRISLDDWDIQGHALKYYEDGNIEVLKF